MEDLVFNKKYQPLFKRPYAKKGDPLFEVDTFIITGGRFSAKSFTINCALATWVRDFQYKALFARYTMSSAKDSIIEEAEEKLEILNTKHEFDLQADRFIHEQGGQLVFKGVKTSSGNQTANLKGLKGFNVFALEEAEESKNKAEFQKISLSIRHPERPNIKILILNPATTEHWIFKEYFEDRGVSAGFNGVKRNVCYIHTSYLDCIKHVPKEILLEFEDLKHRRPKEYNHVVLGGWLGKAEDAAFEDWTTGQFNINLPVFYGMDFGFKKDPTTLAAVAIDWKRKKIYVHELHYGRDKGTDDVANICRKAQNGLIIADNAESRLISDVAKKGINIKPCIKGKNSVSAGIKLMQSFQIVVTPESTNIIKELNNFIEGVEGFDHLIDAIRYVVYYLHKKSQNRGYKRA